MPYSLSRPHVAYVGRQSQPQHHETHDSGFQHIPILPFTTSLFLNGRKLALAVRTLASCNIGQEALSLAMQKVGRKMRTASMVKISVIITVR